MTEAKKGLRARTKALVRRYDPAIRHVDSRLGSTGDARPPIHERLDRLEHYGSHIAEQNDKTIRELHAVTGRLEHELRALSGRVESSLAYERAQLEEAIDSLAERLGRFEHAASLPSGPFGDAESGTCAAGVAAFAFAALASLEPPARVLATGGAAGPIALGLAVLGHELVVDGSTVRDVTSHPRLRSVATLDLAADATGQYDAAVVLHDADAGTNGRRRALIERLSHTIRDRGVLVLTVAIGREPFLVDGPDGLPEGWKVERHEAVWHANGTWSHGRPTEPAGDNGIALLVAVRSG